MSYGQQETVGRKLRRNYDMLIVLAGLAIMPLGPPLDQYNVSINSSVYSGLYAISLFFGGIGMMIIGFVVRICRYLFGSGIS